MKKKIITILLAIPTGILAARKRGKIADFIASVLSLLGISLPSFMMGLGLVLLVAVHFRWLPAAGYKDIFKDGLIPFLRYMTLPALSLGFIHAAYMMRMTKASMLEVLGSDAFRERMEQLGGYRVDRPGRVRRCYSPAR